MPTVPSAQQIGQRVAPAALPNVRLGGQAPPAAFAAAPSVDLSGVANVGLQLYREHQRIVEEERAKADNVAATNAIAEHSQAKTQILYAKNTGALTTKGENAFAMPEQATKQYKDSAAAIRSSLSNDNQRAMYDRYVTNDFVSFDESLQRHVATQRQAFAVEATDSALSSTRDEAIHSWSNPKRVAEIIAIQQALVTDAGKTQGHSPEWVKDQTARQTSITHMGVINQMLAEGADRTAELYFDAHKSELVGNDLTQTEERVNTQSNEGEAIRGATDVWQEYGPKGLNEPVKLEVMENRLREKYSDQPKILKAAITDLHARATAHNSEQTEVNASNEASVLGEYGNGASLAKLTKMPEFIALSPDRQQKLKAYVSDRNELLADRANARENRLDAEQERDLNRRERALERKGYTAFWTYSEPKTLAAMSEKSILALEPELGRDHVTRLMTLKRSMVKAEDVRAYSIDSDLFNNILQGADLNPFTKKDSEKGKLGSIKTAVLNEINVQQHAKGRKLTRDETAGVMQKIVDDTVMLSSWGRDTDREIAVTVDKGDRARAYVSMKEIREREQNIMASEGRSGPNWIDRAITHLREKNLVEPGMSNAQIEETFGKRIERAYAAGLMPGATEDQVMQILEGKDQRGVYNPPRPQSSYQNK